VSEVEVARIQRFSSRVDAEVAASMLNAMGIDARVVNDDTGGMHPNLAFGHGGSEIVVPDDQLEEATALLDDRNPDGHALVATAPPDEGTPVLTVGQLWRRAGAVLLVVLLVLVALSSELDIRWF
jgi:hypothetical protein